ncbi:hypothetical protein EHEL_071160 [Encephalitozoon hellem ATCC 50504]|uniref:Fibronectin-binding protein Bbk32 n=1 Tax=Encephalitozoon hellem TaxID=27973 RepID=A0A9Q9C3Q4_ENCHE|nr:uncharacterized protein EHEL_071160 [Encephalitozoon hellem ATCC 50504]AFM98642.1 hypothetical protein EHEL_071160 [Encephalitozoon hellem ATCC 50504]UTX43591.1 putative fibronectin-binding protein Bbk32 [Encephalitozoon hellem]WEL39066.1 putative fibronectin-binding protein Bbk32 [Encephalitozoon hellem]|eukprot:XP_003887623.1 hypothetical protein EHEL_071160 [Encephalitozoon hellem ATCC 50504]
MESITKETRFNELPQQIKQKLINIYRSSHQQYLSMEMLKPTKFNLLYSQTQDLQTRNLQKNFKLLVESAEKLKRMWNLNKDEVDFRYLHESLKKALEELNEEVMLYKKNEESREFLDEIMMTYAMLRNKLENLTKEKRM